jgi:hypothetical protein
MEPLLLLLGLCSGKCWGWAVLEAEKLQPPNQGLASLMGAQDGRASSAIDSYEVYF